jgi:hypothetical protein
MAGMNYMGGKRFVAPYIKLGLSPPPRNLVKSRKKNKTAQIQRRFFSAQKLGMNVASAANGKNYRNCASPIHLSHARHAIQQVSEDDFEGKTRAVPAPPSKARKEQLRSDGHSAAGVDVSNRDDHGREEEYETEKRRKESETLKALDVSDRELLLVHNL